MVCHDFGRMQGDNNFLDEFKALNRGDKQQEPKQGDDEGASGVTQQQKPEQGNDDFLKGFKEVSMKGVSSVPKVEGTLVPSSTIPVTAVAQITGYIVIYRPFPYKRALDGDMFIEFIFVESRKVPSLSDIRNAFDGNFGGARAFRMSMEDVSGQPTFILTEIVDTKSVLKYENINIGTLPTQSDLGSSDITASKSVNVTDFLKHVNDLIKNSQHLVTLPDTSVVKGFESLDLKLYVENRRSFQLKDRDGNVYASDTFAPMNGGARRGAIRITGALACVVKGAKWPPLKKLGPKLMPDGKVRVVYLMGRLHVVRMRPPGCTKVVPVPVRDLNNGVRRRRRGGR